MSSDNRASMPYTPEVVPPATPETMPSALTLYAADRAGIEHRFDAPWSSERRRRLLDLVDGWERWLTGLDRRSLCPSDALDVALFANLLVTERNRLTREGVLAAEMEPLCPFATDLISLLDERRLMTDHDPAEIANRLHAAAEAMRQGETAIGKACEVGNGADTPRPAVANRAATMLKDLKKALEEWHGFHTGYDPLFTWWNAQPFAEVCKGLETYAEALRTKVAGAENADAIVGDPVGRDGLVSDLAAAQIAYTPEELVTIGEREMAWCRNELVSAASEMGCGDDWRAALERVKQDHVQPGEQARLVRDLAREAVAFLEDRDLLTVPEPARDGWRIEMMSPERQKVNPFFLGGDSIIVSYPTDAMDHGLKLMSMRGNNRHFSRATVQHELIPGHYLQQFCQQRHRPYRRVFYTPFWTEGWTLYWELRLWELGFPRTPEERIGMLFWRMHRCARIVFSLRFHMGEMTAQECVGMLVDEVRHERATAEGEVRRSFGGDYPPLYQCAYMIGGLQMLALQTEMVRQRGMTERAFHDAVMRENCMPIAFLRSALRGDRPDADSDMGWRFYDL